MRAAPGTGRRWATAAPAAAAACARAASVVDPDVRNAEAIARFPRQGFEAGPVVVLPEVGLPDVYLSEKQAQPAFLRREVAFPE